MKARYRPYIIRLGISFIVALVFVVTFTEVAYLLQREESDRAPQTYQVVIPLGTAERVAAGEEGPALPEGRVYVIGDTIEVVNRDSVDHQLGPIWVPPGTSGRLLLEDAAKFSFSCSFAQSRYLGFDVREPTTWGTRLIGLSISVPTTAAFLFVYSLAAFPVNGDKKQRPPAVGGQAGQAG